MKKILEFPKRIAICLIGGNNIITEKQKKDLDGIEDHFDIEWYLRSDIYSGNYWTYSQIINESVISTESEFMIFVNPKTKTNKDDIIEIINDLCSGYCWVGLVAFGLWGTTKELFRHIGLMDERFFLSEYEDNDFALRLKKFGKAIKWESRFDKYEQVITIRKKQHTHTIFTSKWKFDNKNNIAYIVDGYQENKQLPSKIKNDKKEYIYNSWLDLSNSNVNSSFHVPRIYLKYNISNKIVKTIKKYDLVNINITYDGEKIKGFYKGKISNYITLNSVDVANNVFSFKKVINLIYNSDFSHNLVSDGKIITLTLIHDGIVIYDNQLVFPPFNLDLNIGLTINKVVEFI
jgi:hypothetical protein